MTRQRVIDGAVGIGSIVVGVLFAFRPFGSVPLLAAAIAAGLIVAGVGEATHAVESARPIRYAGAAALVATGAVLLAWQGLSIFAIAVVSAVGLVGWAVARFVGAARPAATSTRIADVLLGVAAVALAVAALSWPGVTIFAATFVAGIALIWSGAAGLVRTFRPPHRARHRSHTVLRLVAAVAAAAITVPLAVASIDLHRESPSPDDFYSAPVDPAARPGTLVRSEPFDRSVPDDAQAWRILYTTTRDDGSAALASGLVVAPREAPPGPRPVIAWAHGTTGVAEGCAPSLAHDPFSAGAAPALPEVIAMGAVFVATDYIGLGTTGPSPYEIGPGEARSVLDAVRAARRLTPFELENRTVVWGHSQGGHAALWTGLLGPTYAPEVNVIGVAALAPAADLMNLAAGLSTMTGGPALAAYVLEAYSRAYPDVTYDEYLKPQARLPMRAMASRCLAEPAVAVSLVEALLLGDDPYSQDPTEGPLAVRLRENTPSAPLTMPVFLAQGDADTLIDPAGQKAYAAAQRAAGTRIDFRTYPGLGHLTLVGKDSPAVTDLLTWTTGILATG